MRADVAAAPPVDSSFSGAAKEKRDFGSADVGAGALQAGVTKGKKEVKEWRGARLWAVFDRTRIRAFRLVESYEVLLGFPKISGAKKGQ